MRPVSVTFIDTDGAYACRCGFVGTGRTPCEEDEADTTQVGAPECAECGSTDIVEVTWVQ